MQVYSIGSNGAADVSSKTKLCCVVLFVVVVVVLNCFYERYKIQASTSCYYFIFYDGIDIYLRCKYENFYVKFGNL